MPCPANCGCCGVVADGRNRMRRAILGKLAAVATTYDTRTSHRSSCWHWQKDELPRSCCCSDSGWRNIMDTLRIFPKLRMLDRRAPCPASWMHPDRSPLWRSPWHLPGWAADRSDSAWSWSTAVGLRIAIPQIDEHVPSTFNCVPPIVF